MEARQQRFMYDDRISPMARIYLGEVSKYFGTPADFEPDDVFYAGLFKVSERQVRRWRTELTKLGYIEEKRNKFGKKIVEYIPNLENHFEEHDEFRVLFKTRDDATISNTIEAFDFFDCMINEEAKYVPESIKTKLRYFCHAFANTLFDERFYGIKLGGMFITEEFMQYIVEHFKIEIIYSTAQRVMAKYDEVQNVNLYFLTALVNLYKAEFKIAQENPNYQEHRKILEQSKQEYWKGQLGVKNEEMD